LLEEAWGLPAKRGFIYSIPLRHAEQVTISPLLRKRVVQTIDQIRQMAEREIMPDLSAQQGRCVTCEFRRFCNDVV
jgi:CRISPR-associated exonuclease Cas4